MRERDPCVSRYIMGTEDWARATDMGLAALDTACWNGRQEPYKDAAVTVKMVGLDF